MPGFSPEVSGECLVITAGLPIQASKPEALPNAGLQPGV